MDGVETARLRETWVTTVRDEYTPGTSIDLITEKYPNPRAGDVVGWAYLVSNRAEIWCESGWMDERAYWAALHELGHFALSHLASGRWWVETLKCEAEAWEWAMEISIDQMSPEVARWIESKEVFGGYLMNITEDKGSSEVVQFCQRLKSII